MAREYSARFGLLLLWIAAMVSCALIAGCSDNVAAVVQGHAITEDEVTDYIESFRAGTQRTDDESWAAYLADEGITPEELRKTTIYELAVPVIVNGKAAEMGISVDEAAVDSQVDALRSSLLVEDDESWRSELERYGMTEEKLRENYSNANLKEQVLERVSQDVEPTDADLASYCANNLTGVCAKHVVSVYGSNYDNVQSALASIEEAPSVGKGVAAIASSQDKAGVHYADVGWDIHAELTDAMRNAVDALDKGEISDSPLSEGGIYYLFYVEDEYVFPDGTENADLSDEGLKQAVSELAAASLKEAAGSEWLQEQIEEHTTINDMPSGLSYDVEPRASSNAESNVAEPSEGSSGQAESAVNDGK